jgi:hypothetical protein
MGSVSHEDETQTRRCRWWVDMNGPRTITLNVHKHIHNAVVLLTRARRYRENRQSRDPRFPGGRAADATWVERAQSEQASSRASLQLGHLTAASCRISSPVSSKSNTLRSSAMWSMLSLFVTATIPCWTTHRRATRAAETL